MVLNQDFREFIQSLNDNDVRFLIVGGYAVAFHGHPRYTKDLDIWIWVDEQNAENLVQALDQFGFSSLELTADDFLDPNMVIQLGHPPNRIDLIMSLEGVDFDSCYSSRVEEEIEGTKLQFIDIENLKKNKKAVGRYQDLADLENLQ
jgi:predicted nucleotidyltransferase